MYVQLDITSFFKEMIFIYFDLGVGALPFFLVFWWEGLGGISPFCVTFLCLPFSHKVPELGRVPSCASWDDWGSGLGGMFFFLMFFSYGKSVSSTSLSRGVCLTLLASNFLPPRWFPRPRWDEIGGPLCVLEG